MAEIIKTDGTRITVSLATREERAPSRLRSLLGAQELEWLYLGHGGIVVSRSARAYNEKATILYVSRTGVQDALAGDALVLSQDELLDCEYDDCDEADHG